MTIVRIADAGDPRVAAYRHIRERDLVGRQGLFVAEGKVVLDVLLSAPGYDLQSVLVLESRYPGLEATLRKAPPGLPVFVASPDVMDAIAGFHIHRGILAIGRRRTTPSADELLARLPDRALVLVLVGISNHDNVGSIFRNAAAFGTAAVFADPTCCDPLYRKAIRVSVGGVFRVPFARIDDTAAFAGTLLDHGFQPIALSPRGETDIRHLKPADRTALFLGAEGAGLPAPLLSAMRTVRIAIADDFDSLNVAATSAIALHRLSDLEWLSSTAAARSSSAP
ncbi:RNA methyltransferase [Mesorhizobium sp. LHD-90]|uniref:TrmH family RNA methyltransferase n=1 Tax=Mesorhizobium sp. LHD-90 TaxID=3071414 RepID=UPI0027E01FD9|nr:RNA methyltransferase [Mesorhizobium sp. LHD-90]MDQ6436813.1 RNA methyltransferase [Mesorhizobium sp. LHD-90]